MNKSLGIYNLIDSDAINESIKRVIDSKVNFNTYVSPKGLKELRVSIANFLKNTWNYQESYKDIMITSGSQQSINLIASSLFNDEDTILIEQPTYFGAIDVFKKRKINLVGIDLSEDGFDLKELEERIKECKPKAIYVTPTFNNPTGYAWSNKTRKEFLDIINKYTVLVIEDDPYSLINFTDYKYRTLYEMNNGKNVIYLGTFSKLISPAINVGYVICDKGVMNALYDFKNSFDLCTSAFLQYVVLDYLTNNDLKMQIDLKKEVYKKLLDDSIKRIEANNSVISYTRSKG
ncbi:MAG: PLP-dependent aminotransferase family protein, partial [Bacilli bacterium]|nr:PLP-dependent aminotransferase family protein [Bacilli bacterium]